MLQRPSPAKISSTQKGVKDREVQQDLCGFRLQICAQAGLKTEQTEKSNDNMHNNAHVE